VAYDEGLAQVIRDELAERAGVTEKKMFGGIGFLLDQTIKFHRWPQAGTTILVVIVATILVDTISGGVRRRIIEGADVKVAPEAEIMDLDVASY